MILSAKSLNKSFSQNLSFFPGLEDITVYAEGNLSRDTGNFHCASESSDSIFMFFMHQGEKRFSTSLASTTI